MSDINITFPPWVIVWFLLGQAAPALTVVVIGLAAALLLSRGSRRVGLRRTLKAIFAIVAVAWLIGTTVWGMRLVDVVRTAIYEARHHYRLDKATVFAGIEVPQGSWVFLDEEGRLYEIEIAEGSAVAIDRVRWQGDIRLIPAAERKADDRGILESATLARDATVQGTACRGGKPVEFSEYGGDLVRCTLAEQAVVAAEIADGVTVPLDCAVDREISFRAMGHRLLERCVLAETALVGPIACAGGAEVELSGSGLDACTLATAQHTGSFDLAAGTRVRFDRGKVSEIDSSMTPLSISGLDLPSRTTISFCPDSTDIDYLVVPDGGFVTVAGVKLTGRLNFDCGRFLYGSLFEDSVLHGRALPRNTVVSREDVFGP
jgi:hypothetical protein